MAGLLKNDVSLRDFPYDAYLKLCDIADFNLLENDRVFLLANNQDGNQFLLNLFNRHLSLHPPNPTSLDDVKRLIRLSDAAIRYGSNNGRQAEIYNTVGYLLLDGLDKRVKEAIVSQQLVKGSIEAQYVLQALSERGYTLAFPISRWEKLRRHVCAGDFGYIADRFWKDTSPYRRIALTISFIVSAALIFAWLSIGRKRDEPSR